MTVEIGSIVIAALKATASVGVLSFIGIAAALKGVVDTSGLKVLGAIAVKLVMPALCFTSIGGQMSLAYLRANWGLVAAGVAICALGFVISRLLLPLARAEPHFRPWFVMACTFPNTFAIPLVFIEAICRDESETVGLAEECVTNASTRLFTFIVFFPVLVYGFGATYVRNSLAASASKMAAVPPASSPSAAGHDVEATEVASGAADNSGPVASKEAPVAAPSKPVKGSQPTAGSCAWQLRSIMEQPPVIATIFALPFVFIPWLQRLLFAGGAPLQFVSNALAIMAKAAPCMTNISMAGALGCQLMKLKHFSDIFGGEKVGVSRWTLLVFVVTKMVVIPGTYFVILYFIQDYLPEDRWYRLLLFIEAETPTANNVVLLATVLGDVDAAQTLALCTVTQLVLFLPLSTAFTAAGLGMTEHLMTRSA